MFREVINLILTLLLFVGSVYLLLIFNLALWACETWSSVLTPGSVRMTEKAMLPLHALTPLKKAADFVAVTKPNCPGLKICRHICPLPVVEHMAVKHILNVNFIIIKRCKPIKTLKQKSRNLTGLVFSLRRLCTFVLQTYFIINPILFQQKTFTFWKMSLMLTKTAFDQKVKLQQKQ